VTRSPWASATRYASTAAGPGGAGPRRFHDKLAAAVLPAGPRPDPEPSSPPPSRLAEVGWLATKGTAWALRRSTDLVPGLLALALKECWSAQSHGAHAECRTSPAHSAMQDMKMTDHSWV
jgi:hypothetical protein